MSYPRDYVACGGTQDIDTDSAAAAASAPSPAPHPASETITFNKAEAAVLREALQFCSEFGDGLNDEERVIFDKLDAYFS